MDTLIRQFPQRRLWSEGRKANTKRCLSVASSETRRGTIPDSYILPVREAQVLYQRQWMTYALHPWHCLRHSTRPLKQSAFCTTRKVRCELARNINARERRAVPNGVRTAKRH